MKNKSYLFLLGSYFLLLIKLLVFRDGDGHFYKSMAHLGQIQRNLALGNFIPGHTLYYYITLQEPWEVCLENVAGNIILFAPLGFLFCLSKSLSFKNLLLVGAAASLSIELLQLISGQGVFDVDDIILNTMGTLAGGLAFYLAKEVIGRRFAATPVR